MTEIPALEPWALSKATDLIAVAHGQTYAQAVREIAVELMLMRARGKLEGIAECRKAVAEMTS